MVRSKTDGSARPFKEVDEILTNVSDPGQASRQNFLKWGGGCYGLTDLTTMVFRCGLWSNKQCLNFVSMMSELYRLLSLDYKELCKFITIFELCDNLVDFGCLS